VISQRTNDIVALDEAGRLGPAEAGGKAASLGRLRAAGFPVPDGFVIPAGTLDRALSGGRLDDRLAAAVLAAAGRLGGPLAVRSSGVEEDGEAASHAGQYESVLDVEVGEPLVAAVGECATSGRFAHVRLYREARGLPRHSRLAVLVQRLVPAEAAGVAFTANPVTGERGEVVVSAVRGLGDRLVSGAACPDEWVVRDGAATCGAHPEDAIDAAQVRSVAELARRVEAHEGAPQDIEWALAGGELFLLQARPITALPESPPEPVPVPAEPPPGYWTREATHAPRPWTPFMRAMFEVRNPALREAFAEHGFLLQGLEVRDIGGWEYTRLVPLGGKDRAAPPSWLWPLLIRCAPALRSRIRACVRAVRADTSGRLIERWHDVWLPEFAGRFARLRDVDPSGYSDERFDRYFEDVVALHDDADFVHMRLHPAIGLMLADLAFTCRELLGWDDAQTFALLSGLSRRSTEPARRLAEVTALAGVRPAVRELVARAGPMTELPSGMDGEFTGALAAYQREYGCRALRYEVADPTVAELPGLTLGLIRDQLARGYDPEAEDAASEACRAEAEREARSRLTGRPAADRRRFERALTRARRAYPVREDNEFVTISGPIALVRLAALESGRRLARRGQLGHRDDVFFLEPAEVRAALRSGEDQRDLVVRRKGERAWVLAHPGPPSYGRDPGPPPSFDPLPAEARFAMKALLWLVDLVFGPHTPAGTPRDGERLRGIGVSAGRYTGPVRIVQNEGEFGKIRAGDVLVCPITSPVWSVLFPSIGALVTDTGGLLSHPAIIAREYRVPATVATGCATRLLHDGELVTVDGTAGTVERAS
jgi:rifampicin phosphotransferase